MDFVDLLIKQSNDLIQKSHIYFKWQAPLDIEHHSREDIFKVSMEAMRVTVRLTQVMGWLMLQKAALADETIQPTNLPILEGEACLESAAEDDEEIPYRLRELLKESRELYVRVMRLEKFCSHPSFLSVKTPKVGPM